MVTHASAVTQSGMERLRSAFEDALRAESATDRGNDEPTIVETHISLLGFTAKHAFKLKKPVKFGFVDFSTLDSRSTACDDELSLNRRYSQHVYIDKVALRNSGKAGYRFSNDPSHGRIEDWVVKMRRLPENLALETLIRNKQFTSEYQSRLQTALQMVLQGNTSVVLTPPEYRARLSQHIADNRCELLELVPLPARHFVHSIHDSLSRYLELHESIWQRRVCDGWIVHGHGDLRACHFYLTPTPSVIDCVEFSRDLRTLDLLDEFCFLFMELDKLGAGEVGKSLYTWYCQASGDSASERLVDFYKCYRAVVRWKVELMQASRTAESYRHLAESYQEAFDPRQIVAIGGLSGSGKSVLANALAERLHCQVLHTDQIRGEQQQSVPPCGDQYGTGKYSPVQRMEVYRRMLQKAGDVLVTQRCVILDGTFAAQSQRAAADSLAAQFGARSLMVWCQCPASVSRQRVLDRLEKPHRDSEIQVAYLQQQAAETEYPGNEVLPIDTTLSLPDQLDDVCRNLVWE